MKDTKELNEEFPGNSKSSRIVPMREERIREEGALIVEPKKVRKSIEGRAVRKKTTLTQSIAQTFLGDETKSVAQYILYDVLIPAAKNTIQEMVSSGIEMLLFGETRSHSRRDRDKGRTVVSYGSFYRGGRGRDDEREYRRPIYRDKFGLNEIYFRRGDECSEVLDGLCDILEEYEQVTVADFFELAGIEGATWAHNKWGWEDLRKARCTHTRNGYAIIFPDPIELD